METSEFLAAVLPTAGIYCAAELSTNKKEHIFGSLQELQPHIGRFNEEKRNTYFALASFSEPGKRTAENTLYMRSLFMDLDCGENKAYPTKAAAVTALGAFIEKIHLPLPWLVDSGNGVHAYWPLEEDAPIADWRPVAENLKLLCKQEGLLIDFTVTADAARVLRIPGTFNWKNKDKPKEVKIKSVGKHYALEDLSQRIKAVLVAPQQEAAFTLPGKRLEASTSPSVVKLLENRITNFKTILEKTAAGKGCGQLNHYLNNATQDGMEPLWRGLLSITKVCADGEKASRLISKLHPYDENRMQTKLREIKGPYPCTKFNTENPGVCPNCPSWGKITNPLAFGYEISVDNTEKPVEILPQSAVAAPVVVQRPKPPDGFTYGATGGVFRRVTTTNDTGDEVPDWKQILPYEMFVVDILNDPEAGHEVHMVATRPEGPSNIIIPQRAVVSRDDTVKALAQQNILASFGAGNDKYLFDYIRACTEQASSGKPAIAVPQSYGWQEEGTFVYNSRIYSPQGERFVPMSRLANLVARTRPKGTLDGWRRVIELVKAKKMYPTLALLLVSFGSTLMRFVGPAYHGLIWHYGSTGSGIGKSMSLNIAASVWGDQYYIVHPSTSEVTQEHRQGYLGSLPLIIDEVMDADDPDYKKRLKKMVMMLTVGQGKERMKAGSNEERLNLTMWAAQQIVASNGHISDLFGSDSSMAQGHIRRILGFKGLKELSLTMDEVRIMDSIAMHYGVAGHAWVQWMVRNVPVVQEVVDRMHDQLRTELRYTGGDRIWIAGIAADLAAGVLLSNQYAGIIDVPIPQIKDAFAELVEEGRKTLHENFRSPEDVLNNYTKEYYGNFVSVTKINNEFKTKFGKEVADDSITRSQVKGRVERGFINGHVSYYIEEQEMKKFCSKMHYGYSDFKRDLANNPNLKLCFTKKDMLKYTRGPQMRVNVIQIIIPEHDDPNAKDDLSVGSDTQG